MIIGSLGTISYDLKEIEHMGGPASIRITGAMGSVLGAALGYALHSPRRVIAIIGDGSFLMKMGSISTIMKHKPKNLRVIVLNNNCYKSCGGQATNFRYIKRYLPKMFEVYDVR